MEHLPSLFQHGELQALQQAAQAVHVADALLDYVQDLIAATRNGQWFQGLSPRPALPCCAAARAQALLAGATTSPLTTYRPSCRRPSPTA